MRSKFVWLLFWIPLLFFAEEESSSQSYWDFHPIHLGFNGLRNGRASINSGDDGHLYFRKNDIFLNMLVPMSRTTYLFPRFDWVGFTLDWNQNPKFNETHFYYAQFGLLFYSNALEDWRWIARAEYNLDWEHFNRPAQYGLFSGLLWGKHKLDNRWHYHIGAMATIGMEATVVYPIIGFDYAFTPRWNLEAVFPVVYTLRYKIDEHWRIALNGRPLKERFRVGAQEPQPRSVFCYTSFGTELNLHYEKLLRLEAEIYIGYNMGGNFYIKNQQGKNALYTDLEGAPYAGLSFDYGF